MATSSSAAARAASWCSSRSVGAGSIRSDPILGCLCAGEHPRAYSEPPLSYLALGWLIQERRWLDLERYGEFPDGRQTGFTAGLEAMHGAADV